MATVVTLKVIKVDAKDVAAGIKVGDVIKATLNFNNGAHYYVAEMKDGSHHHLLKDQVEAVDKNQL